MKSRHVALLLALVPGVALCANLGFVEGDVREYSGEPIAAAKVKLRARRPAGG
jgi:hypothetical protein